MTDARSLEAVPRLAAWPSGAIIIPAHNEEHVVARTLRPLSALAVSGLVDVVVVPNGCLDRTAVVARSVPGVRVREIPAASKTAALNQGDAEALVWPRLYLDADVEIGAESVLAVFDRLHEGSVLAARPAYKYNTDGASWLVRSYYRARSRIPALSAHLWGAGAYALSQRARARFDKFPSLTADDLYVDSLFDSTEIAIVNCDPIQVRTPRTVPALLTMLRRVYQGKAEIVGSDTSLNRSALFGLTSVLQFVRGPAQAVDAGVYIMIAGCARLLARRASPGWARDETSRIALRPSVTEIE